MRLGGRQGDGEGRQLMKGGDGKVRSSEQRVNFVSGSVWSSGLITPRAAATSSELLTKVFEALQSIVEEQ